MADTKSEAKFEKEETLIGAKKEVELKNAKEYIVLYPTTINGVGHKTGEVVQVDPTMINPESVSYISRRLAPNTDENMNKLLNRLKVSRSELERKHREWSLRNMVPDGSAAEE